MAFDISNLAPVNPSRRGKAPSMWTYATLDAHATVDTAQYFNGGSTTPYGGAYNLFEIGDIVWVTVWATAIGTGGTLSTCGPHVVKDKASGAIDVTDVTVLTVTDTD